MKYKKLLIFLIAASLVPRTGAYTVFAGADTAVSMSAQQESTSSETDSEAEDSTVNPADPGSSDSETNPADSGSSDSESSVESGADSTSSGTESGDSSSSESQTGDETNSGAEDSDPSVEPAEGQNPEESGTDNSGEAAAENGEAAEGTDSAAEGTDSTAEGAETGENAEEKPAEETPAEEMKAETPKIQETTPEEIEQLQQEDQLLEEELTPVWHPEWQGRGSEFEIHPFKLIFPVYVRTAKEIFVYDKEEERENGRVAKISEGAYIRLIEGDITEIGKISGIEEEPETGEEEDIPAEEKEPGWVFIEAMDPDGNICRGYADGNDLVAARSYDNDRSKVELLKSRDENSAFYDNYLTTYRSLRNENPVSEERIALVNFGLQFLGNPYVWGGESLTEGCDCSGFAGGVYRHFGYDLPRCSYEMCYVSEPMNPYEAQPGDLLFFANEERVCHVMICLSNEGDGTLQVVEAKGRKWGIVVSRVSCERIVWGISILDGKDKERDKELVTGKQVLRKPVTKET